MIRIAVSLFCFLLVSCAYSPQQVTINPVVDTSGERYGNGRPVRIVAEDMRVIKSIGSRGGIHKDTSLITISNDITVATIKAAEAKLAIQGFNVNPSVEQDPAQLKVIIETISYDVPEQQVPKKILLKAVFLVEASSKGEKYSGRYETKTDRVTVVTPTVASNEKMLNALVSKTLDRLFSDEKLKAFLSNI